MGINLFAVRLSSLVFSAVCGGIAGGLFAHYVCFIQPSMFTAYMSTELTAGVVAGGMGSITGPVVAAIIFVAVPEALRVANIWRLVAYGLLLVLIMVSGLKVCSDTWELSWESFRHIPDWLKAGASVAVGGRDYEQSGVNRAHPEEFWGHNGLPGC